MYEPCHVTLYEKEDMVKLDTSKLKKKRGIGRLLSRFSRAGKDISAKWKIEKPEHRTEYDEIVTRGIFINPENFNVEKISNDDSASKMTPVTLIPPGEICKADSKQIMDSEANIQNKSILHLDQQTSMKVVPRYPVVFKGLSSKDKKIVTEAESNIETHECCLFPESPTAKEKRGSGVQLHTTATAIPEILNVQQDVLRQEPSTESTVEDCDDPFVPQSFHFKSDEIEKVISTPKRKTLTDFDDFYDEIYKSQENISEEDIEVILHLKIQNSKDIEKIHFSVNNRAFEELEQSFRADSETDSLSSQTSSSAIPSSRILDRPIVSPEEADSPCADRMPSFDAISMKIKSLKCLKAIRDSFRRYSKVVERRKGFFLIRCMWKLTGFALNCLATFIQKAIRRVEEDLEFYCSKSYMINKLN